MWHRQVRQIGASKCRPPMCKPACHHIERARPRPDTEFLEKTKRPYLSTRGTRVVLMVGVINT